MIMIERKLYIKQYPSNKRCNAYLVDDSLCVRPPNGGIVFVFESIDGGSGGGDGGVFDACRMADNEISSGRMKGIWLRLRMR